MASILRNGLFLISNNPNGTSGTIPTVSFSGNNNTNNINNNSIIGAGITGPTSPLLVGFYPVVANTLSTSPSLYLCPNTSYLIRVVIPGETSVFWLSPPVVPTSSITAATQFTLSINPNSGVTFSPVFTNSEINSFYNFPATLTVGSVIDSQSYQIQPRSDFLLAGYNSELPILLNNCSACGCPVSGNCNTNTGVCQGAVAVCTANSVCGSVNGACPGTCPITNGIVTECQLIGNQYTCVADQRTSHWTQLGWILLLIIGLFIFFFLAGMVIYRQYKTVQVIQPVEKVGPVTWRNEYIWNPQKNCRELVRYPVQPVARC